MKIDLEKCTEEELWKYVATELSKNGVDVTFSVNETKKNKKKFLTV